MGRPITFRMCGTKASWRPIYLISFMALISMLLMYSFINDWYVHHNQWYYSPAPCVMPKAFISELTNLTFVVTDVLKSFKIPYVLCYGTLWGALRIGKILPWDNNVDLCIMKEELNKVPWDKLMASLHSYNLDTWYDNRHGELVVKNKIATCVITVFYLTEYNEVFRDGWEHRFMFFFQDSVGSFPSQLMTAPFPTVEFHGRQLSVPHDDMELLKYLYKRDWWMERPPPGCQSLG